MRQRLYRAQIFIEQDQREALAQIARQEGRRLSYVARELIRLGLKARSDTPEMRWRKRDRVLERAAGQRAAIRQPRGGRPIPLNCFGPFGRSVMPASALRPPAISIDAASAGQRQVNAAHQAGIRWAHWTGALEAKET